MAGGSENDACPRRTVSPANAGQDRAMASDDEKPGAVGKLLSAWRSRTSDRGLRRLLQQPALPRKFEQRHARRCLLRTGQNHSKGKGENQETNYPPTPLATSKTSCIINHTNVPEPPKLKPL